MGEPAFRLDPFQEKENSMEKLTQRVERLEEDTHQIKIDLAVLTARSENFATKADVAELRTELKTGQQEMRVELMKEIAACEMRTNIRFDKVDENFERIDEKFERIDEKFDRLENKIGDINNKITWTLLIPALTAILLWFVKTAILKI